MQRATLSSFHSKFELVGFDIVPQADLALPGSARGSQLAVDHCDEQLVVRVLEVRRLSD